MIPEQFRYRRFLNGLEEEDQEYLLFLREKEVKRRHWERTENHFVNVNNMVPLQKVK